MSTLLWEHELALRMKDRRIKALSAALRDALSKFNGTEAHLSLEQLATWKEVLEDYGEPE